MLTINDASVFEAFPAKAEELIYIILLQWWQVCEEDSSASCE